MSMLWPSDLDNIQHMLDNPLMRIVNSDFAVDRGAPLPLDPRFHRTGDVWHACIRGILQAWR